MTSTALQDIIRLINENDLEKALSQISELLKDNPDNDEAFFWRGKIYWRLEERSKAVNDFEQALAINPESKAIHALENARKIHEFFNPDMFNP